MNIYILLLLFGLTIFFFLLYKRIYSLIQIVKKNKIWRIVYRILLITYISACFLFVFLTVSDWYNDQIPITIKVDNIGVTNHNIYSPNYEEYVTILEYPVYEYRQSGQEFVTFKVTNEEKFTNSILCNSNFIDTYSFNSLEIYMFKIDGSLYYLTKSTDLNKYTLFSGVVKIDNVYIPILPCTFFNYGTYSSVQGMLYQNTSFTWEEIKLFYNSNYSDNIQIDDTLNKIVISTNNQNMNYVLIFHDTYIQVSNSIDG